MWGGLAFNFNRRQSRGTPPLVKNRALRSEAWFAGPKEPQLAVSEPSILPLVVVASQVDVLPLER
jgi:hypothetical protein